MKKMKIIKKLCLGLLLLIGASSVAVADLYTVSNIPISAELDSAKEARMVAIKSGETDAFWALMKKMVAPENLQLVSVPPEEEVINWVQHVSLANEKTTATKYMADLTVRFHENKVQDFLTAHQIPFLTQELPSAVVVPIYEKDGKILALDDQNPLYTYLKNQAIFEDSDKIIVPTGELEEMMWVQEALNGDMDNLRKLSEKYEVESVLLLSVLEGDSSFQVRVGYIPAEPILETEKYLHKPASGIKSLIPQVWEDILKERKEAWNRLKIQNFETAMVFSVQVPISRLSDWQTIRHKLEKANFLEDFAIRGFRPGEVWVSWRYKGTSIELNRQLKSLGFYLDVGDISGVWVLTTLKGDV